MSTKKWGKGSKVPEDFEYIAPIIEALENEIRDKIKESNVGKRKTESLWPVLQINWQRSRYIYDMFYTHKRISRKLYDYCIKHKIADAALIAKWKKPGYERLCSTYVINPQNYKFGTTSICRVPLKDRSEQQMTAQDPTTGCLGCASGKGSGPRNIFGNKYGQNLAAVQIARENRMKLIEQKRREEQERQEKSRQILEEQEMKMMKDRHRHEINDEVKTRDSIENKGSIASEDKKNASMTAGDSETDDDDDDDFGPSPTAGVWAGSKSLQEEAERTEGEEFENKEERPSKKSRME